jgi:hypothetical protein
MSNYNWFGLTANDVINSFSGAISGDFATNGVDGITIIQTEMDRAESDIVEKLSERTMLILNRMFGIEIQVNPDTFAPIFPKEFPIRPSISGSNYTPNLRCYSKINNELLLGYWQDWFMPSGVLETSLVYGSNAAGESWVFYQTLDSNGNLTNYNRSHFYYASYDVDTSKIVVPSLAEQIRNKVCYVLGTNLYSQGDATWKLIDIYGKKVEKFEEIKNHSYMPQEFKKYRWLISPVPPTTTTIKTFRA